MNKRLVLTAVVLIAFYNSFFPRTTFAGTECYSNSNTNINIPEGEVVWRTLSSFSNCSTGVYLEYKKPDNSNQKMCAYTQYAKIPTGYAVTQIIRGAGAIDCNGTINSGDGVLTYNITKPSDTQETLICEEVGDFDFQSGKRVPDGFFVFDINNNNSTSDCDIENGTGRQWKIGKITGNSAVICSPSGQSITMPLDRVVTDETSISSNCSPLLSVKVEAPSNDLWICDGYNGVPNGFAIINENTNYSKCSGPGDSVTSATQIGTPTNGAIVCGAGAAPGGFVKTEQLTRIKCATSNGTAYRVREITSIGSTETVRVCGSTSSLPSGFLVTGIDSSDPSCGNGISFDIKKLPTGSAEAWSCSLNNIPNTHGIVEYSTSLSSCSNQQAWKVKEYNPDNLYCRMNLPYPDNYIIKSSAVDSSDCGSGIHKQLIGYANTGTATTKICNSLVSEIPGGYVIVGQEPNDPSCGGIVNTFTIQQPSTVGDTFVCSISPRPNGFSIVNPDVNSGVSSCSNGDGKIIRPNNLSDSYWFCGTSDQVEDGFVITRAENNSVCPQPFNYYFVEQPTLNVGETITICNNSPILTELVVVGYHQTTDCSAGAEQEDVLVVGYPNPNGLTYICGVIGYSIPEGFSEIQNLGPQPTCGADFDYLIIGPNNLQIPVPFVQPVHDVPDNFTPNTTYECGNAVAPSFASSNQQRNTCD